MYGIATMLRGSMPVQNFMLSICNRINNAAREHARWRVVARVRKRVLAERVCAVERGEAGGAAGGECVRVRERSRAGGSSSGTQRSVRSLYVRE